MGVKAHIVTIGDEILIGQIVDTNSAWIAARLDDAGVRVEEKISVGDDRAHIAAALGEALSKADIVIVTGGLGPTKDDITKPVLADLFHCRMALHQPSFDHVKELLASRGIEFNELNQSQAMLPECCQPLENRNGTAPGMWFEQEGRVLVALPGVPYEMKALMDEQVMPRLIHHFSLNNAIVHRTAITTGLPESVLAQTIAVWEDALPGFLRLAYLPNPASVRLRLSAYNVARVEATKAIDAQFTALEKLIPTNVIGYGDSTVESAVAAILTASGKTLAVAESCTGGAICARFTAMPGASIYLRGGVVSYSNESKTAILGVDPQDILQYGAVSRQVAEQMASGARWVLGADYAIATTGVAGPDGGSEEKPVGTVWIAIATPNGVESRKMTYGLLREQNIERASAHAINMLRLALIR